MSAARADAHWAVTTTTPVIRLPWIAQLYRYVPGAVKVCSYVLPSPVLMPPLVNLGMPTDATLCGTEPAPAHFQVTFPPTGMVSTAAFTDPFRLLRKKFVPTLTVAEPEESPPPTDPPPPLPPPMVPGA